VWPPDFVVARAYLDQLTRREGLQADRTAHVAEALDRAEQLESGPERRQVLTDLATAVEAFLQQGATDVEPPADPERVAALAAAIRDLANAQS
jgi:hypothetical protein